MCSRELLMHARSMASNLSRFFHRFLLFYRFFRSQNSHLKPKITLFLKKNKYPLQMFPRPHPKLPLEFRGLWRPLI